MGDATFAFNTRFPADHVPQAPEDPLYSLVTAYDADKSEKKVDLGVGAYRDENAKPWILPAVKKATKIFNEDPDFNHEYIPIAGLSDFCKAAQKLMLGSDSPAISEDRVCTFQTISGTGAVHLGGVLLSQWLPQPTPSIYVSDPSWPIHPQCFANVRLPVQYYPYFDTHTKMLDFEGMMSTIRSAPAGSILLLHACAHNPTGVDPTEEQWRQTARVVQANGLSPFFDCAYQGFATGSLRQDNFAIRHFVDLGIELIIAQSFAKNMGLYGQRVGAFHFVTSPGRQEVIPRVASQLAIIQRSEISSPPIYGAKIASTIMNDETLFSEWEEDLRTMSGRIIEVRALLKNELDRLKTPGTWDHIVEQIGMFSFTGLDEAQIMELRLKWHIYMAATGRISVAGLNKGNVKYFAEAVDDVVRRLPSLR